MAKLKGSRILSYFLALAMIVSIYPKSMATTVFAAGIDSYSVQLTDGTENLTLDDVEITMTKKDDNTKFATEKTVAGVARFANFVEEEASYVISVSNVIGYEDTADSEVTVSAGDVSTAFVMTALPKVTVTGDVVDENEAPYEGATVKVSGYISYETTTDADGKYSFETYAGKENIISISAKDEDEQYNVISDTVTYYANATDAIYQFAVKTFSIETSAGENGTITASEAGVTYGSDRVIVVEAAEGYRIKEVLVDDSIKADAKDQKTYNVELSDIDDNHTITVSFYKATYTVSFEVGENGKVTYSTDALGGDVSGGDVTNVTVEESGSVRFEATAAEGYHVDTVVIGGTPVFAGGDNDDVDYVGTYAGNVSSNDINVTVNVNVVFAVNEYEVTVIENEHATVTVSTEEESSETTVTVKHGENIYIQVEPDKGYELSEIKVGNSIIDFTEGLGVYQTEGVAIHSKNTVSVILTEKGDMPEESYEIILPENHNTVTDVTYVPAGGSIAFKATGEYKRVRVTAVKDGEKVIETGETVTLTVGGENGVDSIVAIEVSANEKRGDWTNPKSLNITFDAVKPTISDIGNSGKWFAETGTYSFTVADENSDVREVKYASTDDESVATVLTAVDGTYSFSVSDEFNGKYYIWVTDYCGNTLKAEAVVLIDLKDPTIVSYAFSTEEGYEIEYLKFGTLCSQNINVTVSAGDVSEKVNPSGVSTISLYIDGEQALTEEVDENGTATFTLIKQDFEAGKAIYAVATDHAGRTSAKTTPVDLGFVSNVIQITSGDPKATVSVGDWVYSEACGGTDCKGPEECDKCKLWYNGNTTFTVNVSDNVAGIRKVTVELNGEKITKDSNNVSIDQSFYENESRVNAIKFVIDSGLNMVEGKNILTVTVENNVHKTVSCTKEIYIDTTDAEVVAYEIAKVKDEPINKVINFLTFGVFFNEQVQITVTAEDVYTTSGVDTAGVRDITLYLNGVAYETKSVDDENKAVFVVTSKELAAGTVYTADISAVATDNVNNTSKTPVIPTTQNANIKDNAALMLENIAPIATINPETVAVTGKNEATKDDNDWYADNVAFDVSVSDGDSGLREVVIEINDQVVVHEVFKDENDVDILEDAKLYTVSTGDLVLGTEDVVERNEDGSYIVKATVTDNAGNVFVTDPYVIYKDIDDPYITSFDFQAAAFIEGGESIVDENDEALVITTDYGFYFKADTDVIITAKDAVPTAGIKSITYYTVDFTTDANGVKSAEQTISVDENNQITISIPANFKGQIYAKATDNVDNTGAFANPNGAIVESQEKHNEEDHIEIATPGTSYTADDNTRLYSDDVDVTFTVTDTYSGIRAITWSVDAPYDTGNNQSGTVTITNDKALKDDGGWTATRTEGNLVMEMQKTIQVRNNSNNITVSVTMSDRAGNTSTESIEFSIDKTNPEITIVYDDTEVHDDEYTDFFSTRRIANITVKERNFRASDIVYAITNTDGTLPSVNLNASSAWNTIADNANPDNTIHVATIVYGADGDYTFDFAYADNADNPANSVEQNKFTIDMTMPEVTVAYSNNAARNGNYYNADRIATITIKEHNFDAARVNISGVATDNGVPAAFPSVSAWSDNGDDTYTATISYSADAKYSFDIDFHDKANNGIEEYAAEEFYVDKTAPGLSITGIADKSANKGEVAPVITYSDTNFNEKAVTITLSGVNNGDNLKYTGSYADILNGQTYSYANFKEVQSVDDIYTLTVKLTDMAGNETEKTITFSVNRFGSVYDLNKLEDILSKYLQIEEDLVFTETNVDSLDREGIKIKLNKNGTPRDLVEEIDYTVDIAGGDGQWSVYTYTIKKDLFADDGRYSLSIYSKDSAGNVNENIDESKSAEISFGIDKTKPVIVPIDLENDKQYAVDMKTASVEIKDNLVLEDVKIYLNGAEVDYTVEGENYAFDIPKSNSKQNVKIVAVDAAGNEEAVEVMEFLVNANVFVRWYNNTILFIGSIVGAVVLALGAGGFILFGRKKKEEK